MPRRTDERSKFLDAIRKFHTGFPQNQYTAFFALFA
jgi:hypothetical protein